MDTYENPVNETVEEPVAEIVEEPAAEQEPVQQPEIPEAEPVQTVEPEVAEAEPVKKATPKKKKKRGIFKKIMLVLLVILLCGASAVAAGVLSGWHWEKKYDTMNAALMERVVVLQEQVEQLNKKQTSGSTATVVKPGVTLTPAQIFDKVNPAVVEVYAEVSGGYSAGTGFIISEDGYIVTNQHIIDGSRSVSIHMSDGREFVAEIVGADETIDFALLKVGAAGLPCVEFGSSDEVAIGEQVVAIGYQLTSDGSTLTVGYISAKDRAVNLEDRTIRMLQTDAAINSGNSGGPLLNMKGQVIGITSAKSMGSSNAGVTIENVTYAVPVDDFLGIIEDLKEYGYITSAYLGVWVRDVSEDGQSYGLPAGVYVEDVMEDYCAQKAGIKARDIITNLGGHNVTCMADLTQALRRFKAGEQVTVTVYRNGETMYLDIVLDAKPQENEDSQTETDRKDTIFSPEHQDYEDWYNYFAPYFGG